MGDNCKLMRPKTPKVRDKCVKSRGPRHPEWETSVEDKCRRQVWETSVKAAQDTPSERQVWETSVGDKWKTSVNSCGPRNPECEGQAGNKCKMIRPKAPRVGDKCGRQV